MIKYFVTFLAATAAAAREDSPFRLELTPANYTFKATPTDGINSLLADRLDSLDPDDADDDINLRNQNDNTEVFTPDSAVSLGSVFESKVRNYKDLVYSFNLKIGGQKQVVEFMLDTSHNETFVKTDLCSSCKKPVFETSESYSFSRGTTYKTMKSGSATFYGYQSQDYFTFSNGVRTKLRFFAVKKEYGFHDLTDGELGLTRPTTGNSYHNFIQQLYQKSYITSPTFGLYLRPAIKQSYIDIGGYDIGAIKDKNTNGIIWLKLVQDNPYWAPLAKVDGAKVGTGSQINLSSYRQHRGYFDTQVPFVKFPNTRVGNQILKPYLSGEIYHVKEDLVYVKCSRSRKDLWLSFDGYWVRIDARDMLFKGLDSIRVETSSGSLHTLDCVLSVMFPSDPDFDLWVFGTPLMKDYYAIFDSRNERVGLVPSRFSSKPFISTSTPRGSSSGGSSSGGSSSEGSSSAGSGDWVSPSSSSSSSSSSDDNAFFEMLGYLIMFPFLFLIQLLLGV